MDTKTHCKPKVRTSPCNPIALPSRFPDSYALVVLAVLLYNDKWVWLKSMNCMLIFILGINIYTYYTYIIEFREPWFLEEQSGGNYLVRNKCWKLPGSKNTPTYKIQTLVVSWGAAFLYVPMMISMISKVISWNSWTPCQPLTRWWLFRPWWHLPGVKTVFAPKTSVSLQLIQEKFVEYWEIQSNM